MVTGKTAAEECGDSSSVVSSADTNVSLPRVHHRIDSRVDQRVEGNSPSTAAPEYRASDHKAKQNQRHAEDRALEEACLMNDRRKEDEAEAAGRLNEDRVWLEERNRENELAAASSLLCLLPKAVICPVICPHPPSFFIDLDNMCAEVQALRVRFARRKRRIIRLLRWQTDMLLYCHAALEYERYYVRQEIDLVNMPNEKMRHQFRMEKYQDSYRLRDALQLPEIVIGENRVVVSRSLALAVLLKRLAYPNRWVDCMDLLGRERTQLSRIFNATVSAIYRKHSHLLENMDQPWLTTERVDLHAKAIHRACGYYDNCWGSIDGTARAIRRPKRHQRKQYSGHSRKHVMKFQSICTPDGIIANMYGSCAGRRHDGFMLGESNMRERLRHLSGKWGRKMCLSTTRDTLSVKRFKFPTKAAT
ncbi:hypothetical protein RvY_06837 [Ramazzottius varieornatus]|uniref:DDE Tnp4 domain-containing protein n=1 Tax=Ramazzottius varieornatus TaxID=947166 RepID=A0A1D1V2T4_RAMVA|nr:hypothetical protein RvY_06837 [Ramazzottius varieornatus]